MNASDERPSGAPMPQPPPQAFQTPEWETPTNPPRRKPFAGVGTKSFKLPTFTPSSSRDNPAYAKEVEDGTLRHRTSSIRDGSVRSPRSGLRARFDALLPPHRTYLFGLKRRRFLLFVVLPILIFFLFILPLALGLGLRNKNKTQNLPLPTNTGGIFTGDLTYYSPGLGACGSTHSDGDAVGAVSHLVWDQLQVGTNPNTNPLCGRKIRVQRNDKTVDFTVVDRCVGCAATDLDLSPSVFDQVAAMAEGRVTGSWAWL